MRVDRLGKTHRWIRTVLTFPVVPMVEGCSDPTGSLVIRTPGNEERVGEL